MKNIPSNARIDICCRRFMQRWHRRWSSSRLTPDRITARISQVWQAVQQRAHLRVRETHFPESVFGWLIQDYSSPREVRLERLNSFITRHG